MKDTALADGTKRQEDYRAMQSKKENYDAGPLRCAPSPPCWLATASPNDNAAEKSAIVS